jgi:putative alpha-1,2-mannosidase
VPLFKQVQFVWPGGRTFNISVPNYVEGRKYIQSVVLNGKKLNRNWLTHQEIMQGGALVITAADKPNEQFGLSEQWVSDIEMK